MSKLVQRYDDELLTPTEPELASLKEKEREIPFLIKVLSHAVRENKALIDALEERLKKVANQAQVYEPEDPKPDCYTLMGSELKDLVIQMRTNNQYISSMLEGLEI
jgi:hypothetical protein